MSTYLLGIDRIACQGHQPGRMGIPRHPRPHHSYTPAHSRQTRRRRMPGPGPAPGTNPLLTKRTPPAIDV
jgi:hypothetical protein